MKKGGRPFFSILLTAACGVAPAVEVYVADVGSDAGRLPALLEEFDALMSEPAVP